MIALLAAAALAQTLPEVQQRLQDERAEARALAGREAGVLGRLADLERQIEVGSRGLKAAQVRLRGATARLAVAEEGAQKTQAQLDVATRAVEPRLVARYRAEGEPSLHSSRGPGGRSPPERDQPGHHRADRAAA